MSDGRRLWTDEAFAEIVRAVPIMDFLALDDTRLVGETVVTEMPITPNTLNAQRRPHGGVIATLIDHVAGAAAGVLAGVGVLTTDLHVRFLAAPKGDLLRATARIVRAGRRLVVVEVQVVDELGTEVAMASVGLIPVTAR